MRLEGPLRGARETALSWAGEQLAGADRRPPHSDYAVSQKYDRRPRDTCLRVQQALALAQQLVQRTRLLVERIARTERRRRSGRRGGVGLARSGRRGC